MKNLKIEVPNGYEIDKEKSSFETIVFKPIKKRREWKDYPNWIEGWFVNDDTTLMEYQHYQPGLSNRDVWPTKQLAAASLALSQLMQWRKIFINDWRPDWSNVNEVKYCIVVDGDEVKVLKYHHRHHVLNFPSDDVARDFLDEFEGLIETTKPLL